MYKIHTHELKNFLILIESELDKIIIFEVPDLLLSVYIHLAKWSTYRLYDKDVYFQVLCNFHLVDQQFTKLLLRRIFYDFQ